MEKGVFSAPQGKGDLINTLCAIAGLPPTEKTGLLIKDPPGGKPGPSGMDSLRYKGTEEAHLLRSGLRFEGQSTLARDSAAEMGGTSAWGSAPGRGGGPARGREDGGRPEGAGMTSIQGRGLAGEGGACERGPGGCAHCGLCEG